MIWLELWVSWSIGILLYTVVIVCVCESAWGVGGYGWGLYTTAHPSSTTLFPYPALFRFQFASLSSISSSPWGKEVDGLKILRSTHLCLGTCPSVDRLVALSVSSTGKPLQWRIKLPNYQPRLSWSSLKGMSFHMYPVFKSDCNQQNLYCA